MANPSINMPDGVEEEIDDRRHSATSRSKWVTEAILVRFLLEDSDEWDELADEAKRHFKKTSDEDEPRESLLNN